MIKSIRHLLLLGIVATVSCKSTSKLEDDIYLAPISFEEEMLDTLVITARDESNQTYRDLRESAERKFDLIHTKLSVSFDWTKQHVLGEAELTLKPLFYKTSILELDAKNFDIHRIEMAGVELDYEYDMSKIRIQLGREYTRDQELKINLAYTAKPNEGPSSGSAAITSDKGLFFINPKNDNKFKPQQIWTQGETENNSRWFPTIDKPNERCSQEIYVTVDKKFKTLSNGLLLSSKENSDGTRTDYWKQELPHAPYLFMLGIGEYAVVKGQWRDKELLYYVEPEYEAYATKIFNHTPEMLTFFSDILGYPFPWDKYAQIVCRDYVSGAMENTGAVVFGDFVQRTDRELLDNNNDDIVAHEMFHHWFGDLVTCESWSNLTLNEGFATYSEFLWQEYKYGKEAAEVKRIEDFNGYIMTADRGGTHDLIDFEYADKEDMFDGHSYNKGGLIVHMLRSLVGDEAFFASLKKYLTDNAYTDVEAHELRLAFEDVTGLDLNWFFNQWFFDKGHPILDINYTLDHEVNQVVINVEQTQDPDDNVPVFKLPMKAALYYDSGKKELVDVLVNQREQTIIIDVEGDMPAIAVLDGTHDILSVNTDNRSNKEYVTLFNLSDEYGDKFLALSKLSGSAAGFDITRKAVYNPSAEMRLMAVTNLDGVRDQKILDKLAVEDPDSKIRTTALRKTRDYDVALKLLHSDQSYRVISEALSIVNNMNPKEGLRQAVRLSQAPHKPIIGSISSILAKSGDIQYLDYFENSINDVGMYVYFNFMIEYGNLAKQASPLRIEKTSEVLKKIATDESNTYYKKYASVNLIKSLLMEIKSRPSQEVKSTEVVNNLSDMITGIVNDSGDERMRTAFAEYVKKS